MKTLRMANRNNTQRGIGPRELAVRSLSPKHRLFLQRYLRDFNATKAAMAAGYTQNPASARVQGCRLLARPEIRLAIEAATYDPEAIASAASVDAAMLAADIVSDRVKVRPSVSIRACLLVLKAAGVIGEHRGGRRQRR